MDTRHIEAHRHSIRHRDELRRSAVCGCFYCLSRFAFDDIVQWADGGQTAICPNCGIDAVIGDASGYDVGEALLSRMKKHWF